MKVGGHVTMRSISIARVLLAQPDVDVDDAVRIGRMPRVIGTMIPGYLTLPAGSNGKNSTAIVMPHGGPATRDEWGFDWLVQSYAARRYAVLQPHNRGSPGHAALQSGVLDAGLVKAIVAIARVTDLEHRRAENRDYSRFPLVDRQIGNWPHVSEGTPARNTARIRAPVLLFYGSTDRGISIAQSRTMAGKLRDAGKQVELVEFNGLDRQLADSSVHTTMLDRSDAILRKTLAL